MTERFRRQAFETVSEPRLPSWGRLMRMLAELQTGVLESLAPLYALPFARGVKIDVAALAAAGAFTVKHRLGRTPTGWLVLDVKRAAGATGDLTIYRRAGDTRDERALVLYSSASFETLTLWVW